MGALTASRSKSVKKTMKKVFFAGLVTLLPIAITFWVISFIVQFLTSPFIGIVTSLLTSFPTIAHHIPLQAIKTISHILILIALFLFLVFLGSIARFFFLKSLIRVGDRILNKIPLVGKIYKTSKEIVHSLFNPKGSSFKQVVLFPFPYPGSFTIGLIASAAPSTKEETDPMREDLVAVFVPTTPNPTTGYLTMCPKKDLIYLEMSSEAALKYIVSCAVILPNVEKAQ